MRGNRQPAARIVIAVVGAVPAAVCLLAAAAGCDRPMPSSQPTSVPARPVAATQAAATTPLVEASPLPPGWETWSAAQALARLSGAATASDDDDADVQRWADLERVSAAVRLVRLTRTPAACVPPALSPDAARRLRVARVGGSRWALGRAGARERVLEAPVFIDAEGGVSPAADDAAAAGAARLYVSRDVEIVPHILVLPQAVLLVGDETTVAIAAARLNGAVFELRFRREYPYVALVCPGTLPLLEDPPEHDRAEAAQYRWDPDEPGFLGPAMDMLPDPCLGKFELDLGESKWLIAVGGEIPEPRRPPPRPPVEAEEDPPPM